MEVSNVCCIVAGHVGCTIMTVDLKFAELCASQVHIVFKSDKILVKKSTLPLRITQTIEISLSEPGNGIEVQILPIPVFLAETRVYVDHHFSDRTLIGGENRDGFKIATIIYKAIKKNNHIN